MSEKTRVLVVDDSRTMRRVIRAALERDPRIEVVGEAGDPYEAREAIKALSPDVLTLDVEMPGMDGISFLKKLMRLRPTPVVMVSTLTAQGADTAIQALMEGAVDCVSKPKPGDAAPFETLPRIVRHAARARLRIPGAAAGLAARDPARDFSANGRIVLIGASTGGVDALCALFRRYPARCPATLIVQHMPPAFTGKLAARLDQICPARVVEAQDGAPLVDGVVYLAPGGARHLVIDPIRSVCRLVEGPPLHGHAPSVDRLFASAQPLAARVTAALLTGMGRDGAAGLRALRDAGARTIAQDRSTSVVYGMPRVAVELGAVERELPIDRIPAAILQTCAVAAHR